MLKGNDKPQRCIRQKASFVDILRRFQKYLSIAPLKFRRINSQFICDEIQKHAAIKNILTIQRYHPA